MKTLRTELREATVCVMAFGNDREGNGFVLHERKYALELAELAIRLDNARMESEDTPAWARELHQFAEFI